MDLFYKTHLQAFNVISIVLYHSGPTFGQVLYSCQDAFVCWCFWLLGSPHLDTPQCFWSVSHGVVLFNFGNKSKVWWAHVRTVRRVGKQLPSILFPKKFRYCTWGMRPGVIVQNKDTGCDTCADLFGESLDAKHLAETFCSMPLFHWTTEALCCYRFILVMSHNHHELNFRFTKLNSRRLKVKTQLYIYIYIYIYISKDFYT